VRRRKGASEYDQLDMLKRTAAAFSFTAAQVVKLTREIESASLRFKLALELFEKCVDKPKYGAVARAVADGGDLLAEVRRRLTHDGAHIVQWAGSRVGDMPAVPFRRKGSRDRQLVAQASAKAPPGAAKTSGKSSKPPDLEEEARAWHRKFGESEYVVWDAVPAAADEAAAGT
jgi:hypothetical protein